MAWHGRWLPQRSLVVWLPGWVLLQLCGCYMPRAAGEHLQTEMAALRHDVGTLERRVATLSAGQSDEVVALKTQVNNLAQSVNKFSQAAKVADADLGSALERMVQDVQMLRGAVEDNAHSLGEAQTQQNKLTQELTARMAALQPKAASVKSERPSLAAQKAMPTGKKELLAYGLKLLQDKNTAEDGRGVLRDVSRRFASEKGLGDEALYALGSAYVADKKYDQAQRELIRLVDVQPKSPRVAEAFMRLADCSMALGRLEDAQTFLSEVVSNHRRSHVYRAAKTRLSDVTAKLSAGKNRAQNPSGGASPAPSP